MHHLLQTGCDPNARNVHGRTPFHHAFFNFKTTLGTPIETLRRLLEKGADPNVQDVDGNTMLHIVRETPTNENGKNASRDITLLLLKAGADPTGLKNKDGKSAFDSQTLVIRTTILDYTIFCGRFTLPKTSTPEHATATSVVFRVIDTRADELGTSPDVVLKLMKSEERFRREVDNRVGVDPQYVLPIIACSGDEELTPKWVKELDKLGAQWTSYRYGIAMPAAERNLTTVMLQERLELAAISKIFVALGRAAGHLHELGRIHGDLKPSNVMRTIHGKWALINLDASVQIGSPIGLKALSTAFCPPESVARIEKGGAQGMYSFRTLASAMSEAVGSTTSVEPLTAHPTFDVWSLGVLMYRLLSHAPLFDTDDRDNLSTKSQKHMLWSWDAKALSEAIARLDGALLTDNVSGFKRLVICNLFLWILQPKPRDRPQSVEDIFDHPFFSESFASPNTSKDEELSLARDLVFADRLRISRLHISAFLGDQVTVSSIVMNSLPQDVERLINAPECFLGQLPLHMAAEQGHPGVVQLLLAEPAIDADALDLAERRALDHVLAALDEGVDDTKRGTALAEVVAQLNEANLVVQVQRQIIDGVSVEEGQRVRNHMQSLVPAAAISEYAPKVMISYSNGHRVGLDGEGCGLGMQYARLVASTLDRSGIPCFSGLHQSVSAEQSWKMYFEKSKVADVMIAVLTPSFYTSGACLDEITAAINNGLKVIPLVFERTVNGNPPWSNGCWVKTIAKLEEKQQELAAATSTIQALSKLTADPTLPGTVLDQSELLDQLVGTVKGVLDASSRAAQDEAAASAAAAAPTEREEIEALKKQLAKTLKR
eukprot:CAMPEP_0119509946 /NCGR_PEP_ID=MMETSP1344-20130328/29068_1 /TAXON_ID=236787 /ORGANISM="Florenciella parvula, Strain CCMP2471" /LENGTH=829 /DNA_ID=CAMNT_0007546829 /DNA_START=354 /DNA_END=2839 /DNA_ORIENTATION=+